MLQIDFPFQKNNRHSQKDFLHTTSYQIALFSIQVENFMNQKFMKLPLVGQRRKKLKIQLRNFIMMFPTDHFSSQY